MSGSTSTRGPGALATNHDVKRTGWPPNETTLTPGPSGNVRSDSLSVLKGVNKDIQGKSR
jgi:hypothetical protein